MKGRVALVSWPNGTPIGPCGHPEKYLLDYHKSSYLPLDNPAPRRQDRLAAYR